MPILPKLNWGSRASSRERMLGRRPPLARAAVRARRLARSTWRTWPAATATSTSTHDVARGDRARPRPARRAARRRARPRLPRRPARRRLARDDELRRLPAAGLGVAARRRTSPRSCARPSGASPSGCRASAAPQAVATMRAFRAGVPWRTVLHSWTLLDSHDIARFRTVSGIARAAPRRHRPADDDAGRADGLRRRRARARGRVGRGRAPHDAVGRGRRRGTTTLLEEYRRLIALRRSSDALARGGIRYAHVGRGRDRVPARDAGAERLLCLALARCPRTRADSRSPRSPARELETLLRRRRGGARAATAVLPADGPSFHVWRLIDG